MSKKILILVLFLMSVLTISCSNKDKTGDGGTTQTPQGIAKYAGTWTATFDEKTSYELVIGNDGSVIIKDGTNNPKQARDITENGDTYTMKIDHGTATDIDVTITFNNESSGTIDDGSFGKGSIQKNN